MSKQGHTRIAADELTLPWGAQRIRAEERRCATCEKPFLSPISQPRKYCSRPCFHGRPRDVKQIDCAQCGQSFRPTSKTTRYCSHACYGESRKGPRVKHWKQQRTVAVPKDHPIAPPSGQVAYARVVLYDKIGPGDHPCTWCGKTVTWKFGLVPGALIADHLDWDRNNDAPENLVPSCRTCNAHRTHAGNRTQIKDDELTLMRGKQRTRAVERFCNMCGVAFLTVPAEIRNGKGRYCSRSCARRQPR